MLEIFFISLAFSIAGVLKIGIWIGAKRATAAIIVGFENQVSDWEQLVYQKIELENLKQRQNYFLSIVESNSLYNLAPISRLMNLESIGRQLHTTAYIEGQISQSTTSNAPQDG